MQKCLFFIIGLLLSLNTFGQGPDTLNLNFEQMGASATMPEGWTTKAKQGWQVEVVTDEYKYGSHAMHIHAGKVESGSFGSFTRSIPAKGLIGKTIDFSGWMKTAGVEKGFAGIMLRVDAKDRTLEVDNMYDRGIRGDSEWTLRSITMTVPEEAEKIVFGGLLVFDGDAWFDGFKFVVSGEDVEIEEDVDMSGNVVLKNAHYIDVLNQKKVRNADIIVKNGRIDFVGPTGYQTYDDGVSVIDLSGKWVTPGLIDAHVHLFQTGGLYTRPDVINLTGIRSYDDERIWARTNAEDFLKRYLSCGITSVIDVGGPMYNYDIRDKYKGRKDLPNYYMTGPLISTYQPKAFDIDDSPIIKVDGTNDALELVRKQLKRNPDLIKIWYINLPDMPADSSFGMVQAVAELCEEEQVPLAVHATELHTAKLAIKAGANYLVHSVSEPIDDEFVNLCLFNDVVLSPSLVVLKKYTQVLTGNPQFTDADFKFANPHALGTNQDTRHLKEHPAVKRLVGMRNMLEENDVLTDSIQMSNLKLLHENGIRIATGTDAGNIGTMHASSYFEELDMMQQAGLTGMDLIVASTFNAAAAIGKQGAVGSVEKGMWADLAVYDADPTTSIEVLMQPRLVVKSGVAHKPENLLPRSPADLAQQQLNAYNAGNIDFFAEPYADDVEIFNFPDAPMLRGGDDLYAEYGAMFRESPYIHCQLVNRMVLGKTVIDHERVWFDKDGQPVEAIAIYEVEKGKIKRVYFKQ